MNLLTKTAAVLGEIKAAYDAPLLQKALSVDGLGRTLPMQLTGDTLTWLGGTWADKMRGQVWRVASFYATMFSQVPLALYRPGANGKPEKVLKHPVLDLLYQPNPDQGQYMFFFAIAIQLRGAGNCFITSVSPEFGSRPGKPGELWLLPLLNVQPDTDGPLKPVKGYWYTPDLTKPGTRVYLQRKEVLHLKQYNPDGGVWGLGCIAAAEREITGDDSSIRTQITQLQNQGPKGAVWLEPVNNQPVEVEPSMLVALKNLLNGRNRRGPAEVPVIGSKIGYTAFGVSATDLQILEFRRANFSDICSYLGVPSGLLNDKEGTTYANMEAYRKMLYTQSIVPTMGYIASELSRWLVPQFDPTYWLEPDTSNIAELQANKKEQAEWLALAWWIKVVRKQEIMGETPDWDGPDYVVPSTLVGSDTAFAPVDPAVAAIDAPVAGGPVN
jgi:HK97 family phage portal protein